MHRQSQELDSYPMISNLTITQPLDHLGLFDLSITDRQMPLALPQVELNNTLMVG
jgi:hypothetical protein